LLVVKAIILQTDMQVAVVVEQVVLAIQLIVKVAATAELVHYILLAEFQHFTVAVVAVPHAITVIKLVAEALVEVVMEVHTAITILTELDLTDYQTLAAVEAGHIPMLLLDLAVAVLLLLVLLPV
jgi:hypothetical protein